MRQRREELKNNLDYVWDILRKGGEKAREEAEKNMVKVRKAVGLR
jgi:tryptophanyl-tRNA synthetase